MQSIEGSSCDICAMAEGNIRQLFVNCAIYVYMEAVSSWICVILIPQAWGI